MCQMGFNGAPWMRGTSTAANQCQGTLKLNYAHMILKLKFNACASLYRMYVQWTCK